MICGNPLEGRAISQLNHINPEEAIAKAYIPRINSSFKGETPIPNVFDRARYYLTRLAEYLMPITTPFR